MRKFIKRFLITLNVVLVIAFLIGCLLPWLSPEYFWLFGFIGFSFLYITLALIVIILFWLFVKPKFSLCLLVILCCGYKQINTLFAFNTNTVFNKNKPNNSLRLITWNVGNLSGKTQEKNAKQHRQNEICEAIISQNADVICLQEFAEIRDALPKTYTDLIKKYKYVYFPWWIVGPYRHRSGNVIFSKYPIVFSDSAAFNNGNIIVRADIVNDKSDTISFFTSHLDSYKFNKNEFEEIDGEKPNEEKIQENWKQIIKKVRKTLQTHNEEADVVINFMQQSKHSKVFCADLNEVPNNYIYWKLRGNKKDAFLEKGLGLGKTYNSLSTVNRIDYIMPENNFTVHQFKINDNGLSDHAMLIADIELK